MPAVTERDKERPRVGVLLLDTGFERIRGDVGNPRTFGFPVRFEIVHGARAPVAVEQDAAGLLEPFVAAGRRLAADGVELIATSCGFLAIHQRALAAAVPAMVATSALLQVPVLLATLPEDAAVGVVTANKATLGAAHLAGAGVPPAARARIVRIGLERTPHLYGALVGEREALDPARARAEVVGAARAAVAAEPRIAALVLECANLPPYRAAIAAATRRPVLDVVTLVEALYAALPSTRGSSAIRTSSTSSPSIRNSPRSRPSSRNPAAR
jgi:hypothetical protein